MKKNITPLVYYFITSLLLCFILFADAYAFCFEEAAKAYGINQALIESIAKTESNLNPKAVNKNQNGSIDIGLMQINSFWIKPLGLNSDELISNPCYNTMTGAKILKQCIDRYGYTWEAVGCYNATSKHKRANYSWKIFNALNKGDRSGDRRRSNGDCPGITGEAVDSGLSPLLKGPEAQNLRLKTHDSELFLRVRDVISNHELKTESQ